MSTTTTTTRGKRPSEPLSWRARTDLRSGISDTPYMTTERTERLYTQLLRYCRGEQDGVSILISGTRGAGKTTLARLVIQRLISDGDGLVPLPIFLHGPTLLREAPAAAKPRAESPWTWANPDIPDAADEEARKIALKNSVLRGLIEALYRHLSDAISESWASAAEERTRHATLLQLPAHVALTLDEAPNVVALRRIWRRGGFLRSGVVGYLYPNHRGARARDTRIAWGLREIVALASCAHSYLTIVGEANETISRQETLVRRRADSADPKDKPAEKPASQERDSKTDKSTLGRYIPASLATVATSVALWLGGPATTPKLAAVQPFGAIAAGVVIWLLGTVSARFSERRDLLSDLRRNLTIDVDWSERRLERELPVLLQRVKRAGFAPVFVLDELDKLERQSETLGRFLDFSKHIVRDQAAFLFLTNRDYFEQLIRSIRSAGIAGEPPPAPAGVDVAQPLPQPTLPPPQPARAVLDPAVSTYFEYRIFMQYLPPDFRKYFRNVISLDNWRGNEAAMDHERLALATVLIYQARKEPFAFSEFLNSVANESGSLRQRAGPYLSREINRVQLTMQLGLEDIARRNEFEQRLERVPSEAQMLFDALYYIAELHALDNDLAYVFSITEASLADYLRHRAESDRTERLPEDFPRVAQRRLAFRMVRDYLHALASPGQIHRVVPEKSEQASDVEGQSATPVRRDREAWARVARLMSTKPIVDVIEDTAADGDASVIRFTFAVDRYGFRPGDETARALPAEAEASLRRWEEMLDNLLGDREPGVSVAAAVPILAKDYGFATPEQDRLPRERRDRPELAEINSRLLGNLAILNDWRDAFQRGMALASLAAAAVPADASGSDAKADWSRRRLAALRALAAINAVSRDATPNQVAGNLTAYFGDESRWPNAFRPLVTQPGLPTEAQHEFTTEPKAIEPYCEEMEAYASFVEHQTTLSAWREISSRFWAQWTFQRNGPRIRRVPSAPQATPIDLLHASRHGGFPIIAPGTSNLSIGGWCRLLTLFKAGEETVPQTAAEAALAALNLGAAAAEVRLSPPASPASWQGKVLLVIYPRSTESRAWDWQPQPDIYAVAEQPEEVRKADNLKAARTILDVFPDLLGRLRYSEGPVAIHCVETGSNADAAVPQFAQRQIIHFGEARRETHANYVGNPADVAELLRLVLRQFAAPSTQDTTPDAAGRGTTPAPRRLFQLGASRRNRERQ